MMIFESLLDIADNNPDKTAVIQGDRRVLYRELGSGILSLGSFLIEKGVVIGVTVDNTCKE